VDFTGNPELRQSGSWVARVRAPAGCIPSGAAALTRLAPLVDLDHEIGPAAGVEKSGLDREAKAFADMRRKCGATKTAGISLPC